MAVRPKRKVVLVDHNETRQAANGIEEAEVVEIVDHHRIADVMTANPSSSSTFPWAPRRPSSRWSSAATTWRCLRPSRACCCRP
ncbi:MAG: hypothetical protein ACLTMP_02155 [Eggerthella lenta]